jgi:peroxiredoxin Q/BCP
MKINIKTGDKAPLFTLPDSGGNPVSLSDLIGKQNLVVFFYPKDESYGCTKEACSFRDSYDEFKEAGAEVIGISSDDEESHSSFADHHRLPFILLSDKDNIVAELYGVGRSLGMPGRVTFVIDRAGIVRMNYSSQINFRKHIDEALELIRTL